MATTLRRLRNEVQLRQVGLPMFAAFCLGFALGSASYPGLARPALLGGPLWGLRRAVLEAHGSPVFAFGPWDTAVSLGFGALCLSWLATEQRRSSPTLSLPRSKFFRLGLLALGVSCLVAWPGRADAATRVSHLLAAFSGVAVLLAAWPRWRPARRIQAIALLTVGCSLAVFVAYQADYWLLRAGSPRSHATR